MNFYAYYLPQFHEIPENNEWWGQGFTEWTNVKAAKKLFHKHVQPQVPLNNNYYDLTDIETLKWQADLATQYGVNGFIFYHYFFNKKLLLEKPAEMLLQTPDLKMNFFFCWANHSWNRAWRNSREVLLEQVYGKPEDWHAHFDYLLNFFKDERYLKIENKPVFMIFNPYFEEKQSICKLFDDLCVQHGFDGIFIIETYNGTCTVQDFEKNISSTTSAVSVREPNVGPLIKSKGAFYRRKEFFKRVLVECGVRGCVRHYSGNEIYERMMADYLDFRSDISIIPNIFFAWDNTPRHSARGYIIDPVDKDIFFKYMDSIKHSTNMVFVNAWNEWAEGMMLEPTEANKYKYLEWINEWKSTEQ